MSKTIEILKFLRVTPEKKRLIQVRGEIYTAVDDIPDERVRQIVRQSIAEMVTMAGGYERLVADGLLKPAAVAPVAQPLDDADLADLAAEDQTEPAAVTPAAPVAAPPPVTQPTPVDIYQDPIINPPINNPSQNTANNGSLLNRFRTLAGRQPEQPQESIYKLNIAEQIDRLVQAKLVGNPTFVGRLFELRSTAQGDLQFIVDGRSYDSVNDIPDEAAANLFRSAIAEWEAR